MGKFSPHARGWPVPKRVEPKPPRRSPRTRGDGPTRPIRPIASSSFSPHARGWPGVIVCHTRKWEEFSPHARGWPAARPVPAGCGRVLPARAGMARLRSAPTNKRIPVLSARAGMARQTIHSIYPLLCVNPSCAGMTRGSARSTGGWLYGPRTRGDGQPHETTRIRGAKVHQITVQLACEKTQEQQQQNATYQNTLKLTLHR